MVVDHGWVVTKTRVGYGGARRNVATTCVVLTSKVGREEHQPERAVLVANWWPQMQLVPA